MLIKAADQTTGEGKTQQAPACGVISSGYWVNQLVSPSSVSALPVNVHVNGAGSASSAPEVHVTDTRPAQRISMTDVITWFSYYHWCIKSFLLLMFVQTTLQKRVNLVLFHRMGSSLEPQIKPEGSGEGSKKCAFVCFCFFAFLKYCI